MASGNRKQFIGRALHCFLHQTYLDAELIVVDDGRESAGDLWACNPRIRYIRLAQWTSLGTKLNIGIRAARGNILQKVDDDDLYHPEFLKIAVNALAQGEPGRSLVGWDCFIVLLADEKKARFSGHGWVAGGTLCFSRSLWQQKPFRDVPNYEDYWFLRDQNVDLIRVCAPEYYLLLRHSANTWTKTQKRVSVDACLRRLPEYHLPLHELLLPLGLKEGLGL
jgi:glycosyltransferase involved in cell wall biosynthesis